MTRTSWLIMIAVLVIACSTLSACGKKGDPEGVPGGTLSNTYPRS